MISWRINGANLRLGEPSDWDRDDHGKCAHLWVRRENDMFASAWEPTPDELARLNAGGKVVLTIVGGQPPVRLTVES